jgi:hypothetical protein
MLSNETIVGAWMMVLGVVVSWEDIAIHWI